MTSHNDCLKMAKWQKSSCPWCDSQQHLIFLPKWFLSSHPTSSFSAFSSPTTRTERHPAVPSVLGSDTVIGRPEEEEGSHQVFPAVPIISKAFSNSTVTSYLFKAFVIRSTDSDTDRELLLRQSRQCGGGWRQRRRPSSLYPLVEPVGGAMPSRHSRWTFLQKCPWSIPANWNPNRTF